MTPCPIPTTGQGNIVDKRGISPSCLSPHNTGLFADSIFWCDNEQLSSIYHEALLGTNKDYPRELDGVYHEALLGTNKNYPRELDGVIPYDACRENLSSVEIFSKFPLDMDHDCCKEMITKLLSNEDIRQCVQEVLLETGLSQCAPILSQAKFKRVPIS